MVATTVLAALLITSGVQGVDPDRVGAPYFLVRGTGSKVDGFPLKEARAKVTIAGVIARVQVTQVYQNEGAEALEAVYVFPGSTRSAVFAMRMKVGGRTLEAQIEKRDAARKIYQKALDDGRAASLLEQHRPNVFQMNVGNVLPGDRVEVVLDYTELLRPEEGVYELVYPTVVGPRYVSAADRSSQAPWAENPYLSAKEKTPYKWSASVRIAAGMPVSAVTSPSHNISPRFEGKNAVAIESDDALGGNRDFVLRYRLDGDAIETGLLLYEDPTGRDENYFLLIAQPPKRVAPSILVAREYIFVVDVSGSMSGFPLNTAKSVMRGLLGNLRSQDSFNILFFSGGNAVMSERSVPATPENIRAALELVENRRGGGGTEILAALRRALDLPRRSELSTTIAVITDGYVSVEKETYALVRKSLGEANLFAFGVGSSVNRAMIEAMARAGMGEPFFALSPAEAEQRAEEFQRYIESPLLTQAKLELDGFSAYDIEPPSLPDLFASRPLIVFGKYRGPAQGTLRITGTDANGKLEREIRVSDHPPSDDLIALRYLWARDRVARLSDDLSISADPKIEEAITDLGLKNHLLTAFTSFVAVDTLARNKDGTPVKVIQPLPLPQGMADLDGDGGVTATRGTFKAKPAPAYAGRAMIMGSISKDQISRVITNQLSRIRHCYESQLTQNPNLAGKIVVRLLIAADGTVEKAELIGSTINNEEIENCVLKVMKTLRFPRSPGGGPIIVNYPFNFSPAN